MIPYFALFDDNYSPKENGENNRLFLNPIFVYSIYDLKDAKVFLEKVEELSKNNYVTLALSYEFGYAFEEKLKEQFPSVHFSKTHFKKTLATLAVFDKVFKIDNSEVELFLESLKTSSAQKKVEAKITQSLDEKKYFKKIEKIKKALSAGETYQVNFTFKKNYRLNDFCDLAWLYQQLRQTQPVRYGSFFHLPECILMSRSPELFLKREGEKLMTRPMKGTLGKDNFSKKSVSRNDWKKLKAENLIIVDLLRNDLSKVAKKGTVNVNAFLSREKYKTVDQLTSTITCQLKKNANLADIFQATFPCGSVTGAPKIKTMECIKNLEKEARSFYCGALGFIKPREKLREKLQEKPRKKNVRNDFLFNVAIRTLIVDASDLQTKNFSLGVGSGIIIDSKSDEEYFESCLKSAFLDRLFEKKRSAVEENYAEKNNYLLFETMLAFFENGWQIKNLDGHLGRLKKSAEELHFSISTAKIIFKIKSQISNALKKLETALPNNRQLSRAKRYKKVKLSLDRSGKSFLQIEDFAKVPAKISLEKTTDKKPRIYFSPVKLNSKNPFLKHKTTLRKLYESQFFLYGKLQSWRLQSFADILFFNEKNQLCEGSRHNVFLVKNGEWQTPCLSCGLLPGLMREQIIKSKNAKEKILYAKDIENADQIYLTNSLKGCFEVVL